MANLFQSRRFWTFILAQVVSIGGIIIAHFVNDPFGTQMTGMGIIFIEGLAGFLIAAYTVDDMNTNTQAIKAGVHPDFPPPNTDPVTPVAVRPILPSVPGGPPTSAYYPSAQSYKVDPAPVPSGTEAVDVPGDTGMSAGA
jgi:hypothetical protein